VDPHAPIEAPIDAYIEGASALIGLPVAEAHRPGVARFLALAAEMAAVLEAVPLEEDELAPAPVFTLPEPGRAP
jgi:hypothetical protein